MKLSYILASLFLVSCVHKGDRRGDSTDMVTYDYVLLKDSDNPNVTIINKTLTWTKTDGINLNVAKRGCPKFYKNTRLKTFIKTRELTYHVICSKLK